MKLIPLFCYSDGCCNQGLEATMPAFLVFGRAAGVSFACHSSSCPIISPYLRIVTSNQVSIWETYFLEEDEQCNGQKDNNIIIIHFAAVAYKQNIRLERKGYLFWLSSDPIPSYMYRCCCVVLYVCGSEIYHICTYREEKS